MRYESDIKRDYRPKWGFWEGVREVVQNAKDAQTEHSATLYVSHQNGALVILNEGCVLDREALLFGHSSKAGRQDMIGQYGDGFKVGMLALVRSGHAVDVYTGGERWRPSIQRSNKFKADLLVWNIEEGLPYKHRVQIQIKCTLAEWQPLQKRFLFLGKPHPENIRTDDGMLLGDPDLDGCVFVKGIFIEKDPELQNGYNLFNASVDIDRKMVDEYHKRWYISNILAHASKSPEMIDRTLALIADEAKDTEGLKNMTEVPEALAARAAEKFVARYGTSAIPVASTNDSEQATHHGRTGVVVGQMMMRVLASKLETLDKVKNRLESVVSHIYSWNELTPTEQQYFTESRELLSKAGIEEIDRVQINVVDFNDPTVGGLRREGKVYTARKEMTSKRSVLEVLVHECAHERGGGDLTEEHTQNIERIWSKVVEYLWS